MLMLVYTLTCGYVIVFEDVGVLDCVDDKEYVAVGVLEMEIVLLKEMVGVQFL